VDARAHELGSLASALRDRGDDGLERARAAVTSDRARQVVLKTALWVVGGEWTLRADRGESRASVRDFARDALSQRARKIERRLAKAEALTPAERHKVRIAVNMLHCGAQF